MDFELIREELNTALGKAGKKIGFELKLGRSLSYARDGGSFTVKIEGIKKVKGKSSERTIFEANLKKASWLSIDKADFHRTFSFQGNDYSLVDIAPRSRKYPLIAENNKGTRYKFPVSVLTGMSLADVVSPAGSKTLDGETKAKFVALAGALSPENLCCDGEISKTQVRQRERKIMSAWKKLEREVGETVSETRAWEFIEDEDVKERYISFSAWTGEFSS